MKWNNIIDSFPKDKEFVLVRCFTEYSSIPEIITTAKFDKVYSNSWIDWDNNRLTDRGIIPIYWCKFPD